MEPTLLAPHIDSHPEKCGGKPCVAGTRVRVWDVVHEVERLGHTPDEVLQAFPHLTLADVYAAMAYYWDHRDEIEHQMRESDAQVEKLMREAGPSIFDEIRVAKTKRGA